MRARTTLLLLVALLGAGCGSPSPPAAEQSPKPVSSDAPGRVRQTIGSVERLESAIDSLIPADAVIEILAEGYDWSEGPVWVNDGGYLLFSDVPRNTIYRWREGDGAAVWLTPSGFTAAEAPRGESGSNGLLLDGEGRLVLCQHGDRRVARLEAPLDEPAPEFTTLADRWNGKRFSSPNDAVFDGAGNLYFTDPPYGLPEGPDDPSKEISHNGVYRLEVDGTVSLLVDDLTRPNGISLSPDERTLYVANSDPERAIWMAYDLAPDGIVSNGRIFFDATHLVPERPGLPDGLKVDDAGNIFATGPGGVLVFAPDGTHLGTIATTKPTANCAFGNGGSYLYMTADDTLLRIRLE
jgi:gluconolactonase